MSATGNLQEQTKAWGGEALADPQAATAYREGLLLASLIQQRKPQCDLADVCIGDAMKIHAVRPYVKSAMGFEINADAVAEAAAKYPNIDFARPGAYEVRLPDAVMTRGARFDLVTLLGGSLATLEGEPSGHVRRIAECGDAIFLTGWLNTQEVTLLRLQYYAKNGASDPQFNCNVNWQTGTISSKMWGDSFAFSRDQFLGFGRGLADLGYGEPELFDIEPIGLGLWVARK